MSVCVVCEICESREEAHIIYQTPNIISFLDHVPINEGHVLVCPRYHYPDITDIPDEVLGDIFRVAKRVAAHLQGTLRCDGVSLLQNNGRFNDLGHFHLHVFPRYAEDGFAWVSPNIETCSADRLARVRRSLALP